MLLSLFMGNDIAESGRYHQGARSLRDWYDRENLLLYLLPKRVLRSREANLEAAKETLGEPSDLGSSVPGFSEDTEELESAFPWLRDPRLEESWLSPEAYLEVEKARIWQVFRAGQLDAFDELFPALERIHEACGDIPLLVLLIPTEMQVDDEVWDMVRAELPGDLVLDRDQPQRIVASWLERRGIPYLDPLERFRAVPPLEDGKRHLFHRRDTHVNRRGNEVLGSALAEFLSRQIGAPTTVED